MASDILHLKQKAKEEQEQIALLRTNKEFIDHFLTDLEEIKNAIIAASVKLEKRLDVLAKLLVKTQTLDKKYSPASQ